MNPATEIKILRLKSELNSIHLGPRQKKVLKMLVHEYEKRERMQYPKDDIRQFPVAELEEHIGPWPGSCD